MGGFGIPPPGGNQGSEIVNEARATQLMTIFVDVFRRNARPILTEAGEETASEFVDELKFRIASQAFHHRPLNPAYLRGKIRSGLDPRTLIATGEYLDSIMYEQVDDEAGQIVFRCTVRPGVHGPSGLSYRMLARIHEFGARRGGRVHIPARPHWRPMAAIYRDRAPEIGRRIRANLVQRVREGMAE